ncbi:MAG: ribosome maturation factor RimP [Clostridiales Family XIII bacterium]|jgi:ribosome maturation factor RimP|nr:ribosome maturation factor RimP [Clostridiales Family XIII bacterium]
MAKKTITELTRELLSGFLPENGYELCNAEFVKEGKDRYLRVYVDRIGADIDAPGIGTDDCERISRFLSAELDAIDPMEQQYYLEVSSPGLDRALLCDADFARFAGRPVEISLYRAFEGKKKIEGTLVGLANEVISIDADQGRRIDLPRSEAAVTRLKVIF